MRLEDIDLNLLVTLRSLLKTKNVSKTARAMGLTQPAVSNALARLRDTLQDPIFVRSTQGFILTERAEKLTEPLTHALQAVQEAISKPANFNPLTDVRRFTIAVTDYAHATLVPYIIARLAKTAPHCRVGIRPLPSYTPIEELSSGEFDLSIVYRIDEHPGLKRVRLQSDQFVCIVRKDHPEVGKTLSLKKFASLKHAIVSPLISRRDGEFDGVVDRALVKHNLKRHVAVSVPQFFQAPLIVANSDYIMTVGDGIARTFAHFTPIKVIPCPLELHMFETNMLWHERNDHDPAMIWLRKEIASVTRELAEKRQS
jgi:DNA-binding transcriptional LysR family regulator